MAKKEAKAELQEPTEEYVIKTAKVIAEKKGDFSMELVYDRVETDERGVVSIIPVTENPPFTPHQDLFIALKRLVPHWAVDSEFKTIDDFNKKYFESNAADTDEGLKQYKVTGIHLKEKNGKRFVSLVGRKILSTGKVINHSPVFNIDAEDSNYLFNDYLKPAVESFIDEVGEYMGGKHAPSKQLELIDKSGAAIPANNPEEDSEKRKVS